MLHTSKQAWILVDVVIFISKVSTSFKISFTYTISELGRQQRNLPRQPKQGQNIDNTVQYRLGDCHHRLVSKSQDINKDKAQINSL